MAEIVCLWGGGDHPVENEGGAGKIVPLHFWTSVPYLTAKKIIFSTKILRELILCTITDRRIMPHQV